MSPWFILAIVVAAGAAAGEAYHAGHVNGATAQKVVDQNAIDKVNDALEAQKTLSRKIVAASEQHALDDARHNQEIQTEIEHHDEENRAKTAAIERKYAGAGLQYGTPAVAGRGASGADGVPPAPTTPGAEGTTVSQLPGPLAARLRQHAADADSYADEYRKCTAYEAQVAAWVAAHAARPQNGQ